MAVLALNRRVFAHQRIHRFRMVETQTGRRVAARAIVAELSHVSGRVAGDARCFDRLVMNRARFRIFGVALCALYFRVNSVQRKTGFRMIESTHFEGRHVVARFALRSELSLVHVFVARCAVRFHGQIADRLPLAGGECPFLHFVTFRAGDGVCELQLELAMVEFCGLESVYRMTRIAGLSELSEMRIFVAIGAFGKSRQLPFSARVTRRALYLRVFSRQRELLVLYRGLFPARHRVTARAVGSERSFVRVLMAVGAVCKRKSLEHLILVAGHARDGCMGAFQRIVRCAVIKLDLFHRLVDRVTGGTIGKISLVRVAMAGCAIGA